MQTHREKLTEIIECKGSSSTAIVFLSKTPLSIINKAHIRWQGTHKYTHRKRESSQFAVQFAVVEVSAGC